MIHGTPYAHLLAQVGIGGSLAILTALYGLIRALGQLTHIGNHAIPPRERKEMRRRSNVGILITIIATVTAFTIFGNAKVGWFVGLTLLLLFGVFTSSVYMIGVRRLEYQIIRNRPAAQSEYHRRRIANPLLWAGLSLTFVLDVAAFAHHQVYYLYILMLFVDVFLLLNKQRCRLSRWLQKVDQDNPIIRVMRRFGAAGAALFGSQLKEESSTSTGTDA